MPGHGLQARGIAREQKMIYAGMTLFLEQGYEPHDDGADRPQGRDVSGIVFCRV